MSTLRIEIARVIPLETEGRKRGASADVIPAVLTPDGASEPPKLAYGQNVAVKKLRLDCDTDDARVLAVSGGSRGHVLLMAGLTMAWHSAPRP